MSKHKRKAKRLLTCPRCGIGGFVNLKHHVCKKGKQLAKPVDLELIPPNDSVLKDCADQIRRLHGVILGKTQKFQEEIIYDFVEWGLYFLKAKARVGHGHFVEFLKSATVADLNISDRSANNYMNAARNAGLTEKSTAEDVEKLRSSKALHGRKPTELYRLMDAEEQEEEETPRGKRWQLMRDAACSLREQCEAIEQLRDGMNKKVYSTVCARLHRTLENLTGSDWDIVEKKQHANFKEHGDVYEIGS